MVLPSPASIPTPAKLGKSIAHVIMGHSVFIPVGAPPTSFTPKLARHFMLLEGTVAVPALALAMSHYVATFATRPERTVLARDALKEAAQRSEALVFWTQHLTPKREDPANVAQRSVLFLWQVMTFPAWLLMAGASPALVHSILAESNVILDAKYGTTQDGAPGQFHGQHMQLLQQYRVPHEYNANSLDFDPAAAFIIFLLVVFNWR